MSKANNPHRHPAPGVRKPEAPKLPPYSKSALQLKAHTGSAKFQKGQAAFDKAKAEQQKIARAKPGVKPIYAAEEGAVVGSSNPTTGTGTGPQAREAASNISKGFGGGKK